MKGLEGAGGAGPFSLGGRSQQRRVAVHEDVGRDFLLAESLGRSYGLVPMARYVFITGGVVSSLGKGIAAAALGALLQARGYRVRLRKLDPYLNVDPGTMSPYQHGEVFVTDDGAETDLDLGHYERFTGRPASQADNITSGNEGVDFVLCEIAGTVGAIEALPFFVNVPQTAKNLPRGLHAFLHLA